MPSDVIQVEIQRGSHEESHNETFEVPAYDNQTVLDVVSWVQQNTDPNTKLPVCMPCGHVR